MTVKTLRRRFFSPAGRLTRSSRQVTLHLPQRCPWETHFSRALDRLPSLPIPSRRRPSATAPPPHPPSPSNRRSPQLVPDRPAGASCCLRSLHEHCHTTIASSHWADLPQIRPQDCVSPPLPSHSSAPTTRFGGFGLSFAKQCVPSCLMSIYCPVYLNADPPERLIASERLRTKHISHSIVTEPEFKARDRAVQNQLQLTRTGGAHRLRSSERTRFMRCILQGGEDAIG